MRRRLTVLAAAAATVIAAAVGVRGASSAADSRPHPHYAGHRYEPAGEVAGEARTGPALLRLPSGADVVTIGRPTPSPPIPAGFLGLSLEYFGVEPYVGSDPSAIDPVLVQLIRNLTPGQAPVLRIGGDSTDWTWWPNAHVRAPGGVTFAIDRRWLAVTRALARALGARLILGINLEADSSTVAAAEANALVNGIGRGHVEALELGNEPELYGTFAWYTSEGQPVTGRPAGYDFADFTDDFSRISRSLPHVPLAGPSIGVPTPVPMLSRFLEAEPRLGLVSFHAYPLLECFTSPSSPRYPTIARLLSPSSSRGLAASLASYASTARQHHLPFRVDEFNSVGCGASPGVSNTFASSLWVLDTSFAMAQIGVAGINVHTYPGSTSQLFTFSHRHDRWSAIVQPEYYGLMMFAAAAPAGSRLLHTEISPAGAIRAWATSAPGHKIHVVLINDDSNGRVVCVRARSGVGPATLEDLLAPNLAAQSAVTLSGQGFGRRTTTGLPAGRHRGARVAPLDHNYVVTVPATSAVMLTFARL